MPKAVRELLNLFSRLSQSEREDAFSEISKRLEYPALDDEAFAQVADQLWLIYDAEESANGHLPRAD